MTIRVIENYHERISAAIDGIYINVSKLYKYRDGTTATSDSMFTISNYGEADYWGIGRNGGIWTVRGVGDTCLANFGDLLSAIEGGELHSTWASKINWKNWVKKWTKRAGGK